MYSCRSLIAVLIASSAAFACGDKEKKGKASAALMKSETVSTSLTLDNQASALAAGEGSMIQSFTPSSLKVAIFRVNLCQGMNQCYSIYECSAGTVEGCGVELSHIDAFVDQLNASSKDMKEGEVFDHIGVEYCQDGNRDGLQHFTVNGTVKIQGVDYATDPSAGLVQGTTGKDVSITVKRGCASVYQIYPEVTISADTTTTVKMFFDSTLFNYAGLAGGAENTEYYDVTACAGSSDAYVCAPGASIVATVDSGNPTTEHYLLSDTSETNGGSTDSAPTATIALYYSSSGVPIGGVQNPFRLSGSTVKWGHAMNGGVGLYPKVIDADTLNIGEPGGDISLADWFKTFKRSSHTGSYTYAGSGGTAVESTYKASKL